MLLAAWLLGGCAAVPGPAPASSPAPSRSVSPGPTDPVSDSFPGRWLPQDFDGPTEPDLELFSDGSWRASDGCNETVGRWAVDVHGSLTEMTAGPSTLIGCEGVATAALFQQAVQLRVLSEPDAPDVRILRLSDADGKVLLDLVPAGPVARPSELVGVWRVSGIEGEMEDSWLELDGDGATLRPPCGAIDYQWAAHSDLVVFSLASWPPSCGGGVQGHEPPTIPWLAAIRFFHLSAAGIALLGPGGTPLATLHADGTTPPSFAGSTPPVLTDELRERLDAPVAPLPVGLTPATPEELVGRWHPTDFSGATEPYAEFRADGSWTGSDGCNESGGSYVMGAEGLLLATLGAQTLIDCEGVPSAQRVAEAGRVALRGDSLSLYDASGRFLAAFVRV